MISKMEMNVVVPCSTNGRTKTSKSVSVPQMETEDNWDDLYSSLHKVTEMANVESIHDWLNEADGEVWDISADSQAERSSGSDSSEDRSKLHQSMEWP